MAIPEFHVHPSASVYIRFATRSAHTALERTGVGSLLMSEALESVDYLKILERWLFAWVRLEELLAHYRPSAIDSGRVPEARAERLRRDIQKVRQFLGHQPTAATLEHQRASTLCTSRLTRLVSTECGWLGLAYVMQGSKLGNAVVASHLQRVLPIEIADCASFFSFDPGDGMGLAQHWRLWLNWFDLQLHIPPMQEIAARAAILTFDFMSCALGDSGRQKED